MTNPSSLIQIAFHGTTAGVFESFEPKIRKGEQLGFGIHFSSDPHFANLYASDELTARKGKYPTIYIVELQLNSPLKVNQIVRQGTEEFEFAKKLAGRKFWTSKDEDGTPCAWLQSAIDATSPSRARDLLTEAGFDSVVYESVLGTRGVNARIIAKSPSFIALSNEQVKIISTLDLKKQPLTGETPTAKDADLNQRVKKVITSRAAERIIDNVDNATKGVAIKKKFLP